MAVYHLDPDWLKVVHQAEVRSTSSVVPTEEENKSKELI